MKADIQFIKMVSTLLPTFTPLQCEILKTKICYTYLSC